MAGLTQYQPTWLEGFHAEEERLRAVFGTSAFEIEHIGSTSVEGMPSIPIIDIAVMIHSQAEADGFTELLAGLDYTFVPPSHPGTPERHYYTKGDPEEYHLSLAYTDVGGFWHRQILFRDYLRSNKQARDEYAALKKVLIRDYPSARGPYSQGKTEFVYRVLKLAGWRVGQMYKTPPSFPDPTPSVTSVVPNEDYSLVVTFDDGRQGVLGMKGWLGTGALQGLATYEDFTAVHVSDGTIKWDCGVTLDADYVYERCE